MITIEQVFSIQNEYSQQIFDLINFRRINQLIKYTKQQRLNNQNLKYCESHHIIPKSYFKKIHVKCDNSNYNLVNLTAREHIKIHILLYKYFKSINDAHMYNRMLFALNRMIRGKDFSIRNIEYLSYEDEQYFINEYEKFKLEFSNAKLGKRTSIDHLNKWPFELVKQINDDYLNSNFNWDFIKQKYSLSICRKSMYRIFKFYNLKYSRNSRLHMYDKKLYESIRDDYEKYGYKFVKDKYHLMYCQGNLFRIFKTLNIKYKKCFETYKKYSYDFLIEVRNTFNLYDYEYVKQKYDISLSENRLKALFRRYKLSYKGQYFVIRKNKK